MTHINDQKIYCNSIKRNTDHVDTVNKSISISEPKSNQKVSSFNILDPCIGNSNAVTNKESGSSKAPLDDIMEYDEVDSKSIHSTDIEVENNIITCSLHNVDSTSFKCKSVMQNENERIENENMILESVHQISESIENVCHSIHNPRPNIACYESTTLLNCDANQSNAIDTATSLEKDKEYDSVQHTSTVLHYFNSNENIVNTIDLAIHINSGEDCHESVASKVTSNHFQSENMTSTRNEGNNPGTYNTNVPSDSITSYMYKPIMKKFLQYNQHPSYILNPLFSSTLYSHTKFQNYFRISNQYAWSPDGTCFLVYCPEEEVMKLFELPQEYYDATQFRGKEFSISSLQDDLQFTMRNTVEDAQHTTISNLNVCLTMKSCSPIYDMKWNINMNSNNPSTSFFISSSKGGILTIWDAFRDNCVRHTVRVENHLGRSMDAFCIQFYRDPEYILCGLNKSITIIPIEYSSKMISINTQNFSQPKLLSSIISCIEYNHSPGFQSILGFGNYGGDVGLIDDKSLTFIDFISRDANEGKGITQLQFSSCGKYLYTATRSSCAIKCWDLRMLSAYYPLYTLERDANTNQRIGFDISQNLLYSGSRCGNLIKYDLLRSGALVSNTYIGNTVVNGVSIHPILPYIAVTTGERVMENIPRSDCLDQDSDSSEVDHIECVKEPSQDETIPNATKSEDEPQIQVLYDVSLL